MRRDRHDKQPNAVRDDEQNFFIIGLPLQALINDDASRSICDKSKNQRSGASSAS